MKKILLVVVALAIVAMTGAAMAADTAVVTVSATVQGTCKFTAGGAVTYALDPSVGGDVNGTVGQPTFWCTKGAAYTITDDNGLYESGVIQRMKHATLAEYIEYSFSYTAGGAGTGPTTPITMDIASNVLAAQYLNASAGNYADSVTLSILP
jgi:spore coat protein U-like protein